ncbi:MAG: nickel pincer cofactor biosynthesis protein LarC [Pyrinomonadaceae bacterium]|nr:nickel pincer cofactor biosynthesis protein LarC [Pyrinomonadaceae bacterium]
MRTLYFDCFAGASGNMLLGALFGLGVDREEFLNRLSQLGLSGYEIAVENVDRSGISSVHVDVKVPEEKGHRHLRHIREIIAASSLSEGVKDRAVSIFTRLAEAEARVHGIDVEKVHFHEVGAMDAIIDIVGACIAFEMLGVEQFACSKIHVGSGFVNMEHGKFPVPPPAVAELLKGKPIYSTEIEGELITPTGAAIISTVCDKYGLIPEMSVEATGYGAGTRTYKGFPNVVRLLIGEADEISSKKTISAGGSTQVDQLVLLETNVDDVTPQVIGYAMERAFALGALDCWVTPILMKKNRPAHLISVLCRSEQREAISEMLFTETTTVGLRVRTVDRESLEREILATQTEYGEVRVKVSKYRGKVVNAMPEYDDVARIAAQKGIPFKAVSDAVMKAMSR